MHMAWLRHIGGRLKSDYRYSIGLVYNTFPTPPADADLSKLEPLAQAVLDVRAAFPDATLADLYDPDLMPPALRRAHQALDRAVDRLYRRGGFASERERVEHLFMLYETMRAPLEAAAKTKHEAAAGAGAGAQARGLIAPAVPLPDDLLRLILPLAVIAEARYGGARRRLSRAGRSRSRHVEKAIP